MLQIKNKRILLLMVLAVSTAILLIVADIYGPNDELSSEQFTDYPHKRTLSYEFRVQNKTPRLLKVAEVRAYISAGHASTQLAMNIDHKDDTLVTDGVGNKLVLVKFGKMGSGDSAVITVAMDLAYRSEPKISPEELIDLYRQNDSDLGGLPGKIKKIVNQVKGDSAQATVDNISKWMRDISPSVDDNTDAQEISPALPIEHPLIDVFEGRDKSPVGRVNLFIALCRAAGLPARGVVGAIIDSNANANEITKFSIWPEYFYENVWHITDINNTKPVSPLSNYIALRTIENMTYLAGSTAESYLFETVSVNVVPGSVKLRVSNLPSQ